MGLKETMRRSCASVCTNRALQEQSKELLGTGEEEEVCVGTSIRSCGSYDACRQSINIPFSELETGMPSVYTGVHRHRHRPPSRVSYPNLGIDQSDSSQPHCLFLNFKRDMRCKIYIS